MEPYFSHRKADAIGNGAFLLALALMIYNDAWWPWIILALWANVALRQFLTGRLYDLAISSFIFLGLYFLSLYKLGFTVMAPVLLVTGGLFIIFREFFFPDGPEGEDKSEEIKDDISDSK